MKRREVSNKRIKPVNRLLALQLKQFIQYKRCYKEARAYKTEMFLLVPIRDTFVRS